jgi:hypothetical protein
MLRQLMQKRLVLILTTLVLTGFGRKPVPQAPLNDEPKQPPRAEFKVGGNQDEPRHLSFKITAIHEKHKPSPHAPFHVDGGEWTFFDCQASSDPNVAFTVGVLSKSSTGNVPVAWGKAVLIVKDREAGARFVELFSKAFAGKQPKPLKQAYVPGPLSVRTAILGHNMHREQEGGFSGEEGDWTATKWFLEAEGQLGEVYFNYNLAHRQGEFSEKDADYADDLVAILASALRDGPRPERTPENDPSLTRIGPALGKPRKLLARSAAHERFTPKARFAVYQDGTTILALSLDRPEAKPFEVVRFDNSPWTVRVLDDDLTLLVQEGVPETPGVRSSGDPMRIWWVGGKGKEKKLLRGPEKDLNLAEEPVSPDQRYVALSQWQGDSRKEGRTKVLHILDRASGKSVICNLKPKDLSVVGWKQTDAGLRVAAVTNRWQFDKKEPSELYLADPATGILECQEKVDARLDIDNPLSPDGKHRVHVGKDELVVTDVGNSKQRRFVFHEDDRRFVGPECIEWVNPRYLKFNGPRLALIDVTTMKMCFPPSADGTRFGSNSYTFSSDFRWVLYQGETSDGEGLFLAPVEMPKEP